MLSTSQDFLLGTPQRVFHDIDELVEVVQANLNERMQAWAAYLGFRMVLGIPVDIGSFEAFSSVISTLLVVLFSADSCSSPAAPSMSTYPLSIHRLPEGLRLQRRHGVHQRGSSSDTLKPQTKSPSGRARIQATLISKP